MNKFEELGLSHQLLKAIEKLGINTPTQIQEKSIPLIIDGKDVVGESATGSGKTLAFGCGIVEHTVKGEGLQALVLAPTRELAEQVRKVLNQLSHEKQLNVVSIYGGVSIGPQIHDLTRAEVVVGTPGRLLDHVQRRTINLSKIKTLVLDEADRMLDMGFMEDVEKIIRLCPKNRQTLFFSATISNYIKNLANKYMNNPKEVSATKMVDPTKLKQSYYDISRSMKLSLLVHLLNSERSGLVMVFCNTRRNVDFVVKNLKANKIHATAIHGGHAQNKRSKTLEMFNDAEVGVLVCTDVAARGLHIDHVSHVYNFDIPKDATDYVHRAGRTARAGEEGKVINLLGQSEHNDFSRIQRDTGFKVERAEKPFFKQIDVRTDNSERRDENPRRGGFRRGPPRRGGNFHRSGGNRSSPRGRFNSNRHSGNSFRRR